MVGERIEERRKALGWKRSQLAEHMGVGVNTVFRWEKNHRAPSDKTKRKLSEVLNTSVAYLMGETDDPNPTHYLPSPSAGGDTAIAGDHSLVAQGASMVKTSDTGAIAEHGIIFEMDEGDKKMRLIFPRGMSNNLIVQTIKSVREGMEY